ncbi:MAG: adaptor protein MecA [Candidatus Gastranaerophilales bacterium]|nr:adaptor protein MecA [Candidatus Gastranaerophilales bacterium]
MKIERVDDKTVKCFLSNEELEEYDIDYKDFVLRSEKAKEIVREIIEHATEEVGYKPPQFAFDLQIMMLPEQGLLLTFSEREPFEGREGEQIVEYLRQMKNILQQAKDKLGAAAGGNGQIALGEQQGAGAAQAQRPDYAIFSFDSLSKVMDYAAVLPGTLRVKSSLYKMGDIFYLYMKKGAASYERYSRACIQALEFGDLYAADEGHLLLLKEHGECLIEERALKRLNG